MSRSIVRTLTSKRSARRARAAARRPGRPQLLHERIDPVEPVHVPSLRAWPPATSGSAGHRGRRRRSGALRGCSSRSRRGPDRRARRRGRSPLPSTVGNSSRRYSSTRSRAASWCTMPVLPTTTTSRSVRRRSTPATSSPSSRTEFASLRLDASVRGDDLGTRFIVTAKSPVRAGQRCGEQLPRGAPEQQRAGVEDGVQPELVSGERRWSKRDAHPPNEAPHDPSGSSTTPSSVAKATTMSLLVWLVMPVRTAGTTPIHRSSRAGASKWARTPGSWNTETRVIRASWTVNTCSVCTTNPSSGSSR